MNESDLEIELRKLRPATPSRSLAEGIARDLAGRSRVEEPRVSRFTLWLDRLLWSGLGATAMLALMLLHRPPAAPVTQAVSHAPPVLVPESAPLPSSSLQPVFASDEHLGWRDEGVRFDPDGQPLLKLRRVAMERKAWADLEHAGVVQMETPRQEVMWVPVTLH